MAKMKFKDLKNMGKGERENKIKELKMELVKSKGNAGKKGANVKEIRKTIARIKTIGSSEKGANK